jgi:hypothetical protein
MASPASLPIPHLAVMPPTWEIIVEKLRAELQGYGGLLQLFNDQRENMLRGDADTALACARAIEAQTRLACDLRARREAVVADFALAHQRRADCTLRELSTELPPEVRPLLSALIDEINHLIRRVGRGARQTHQMLGRIVEVHHDALRAAHPEAFARTYSSLGQFMPKMPLVGTLRATG